MKCSMIIYSFVYFIVHFIIFSDLALGATKARASTASNYNVAVK